jgi:alkylated DNA nucleotide flippase Atl1
MLMQLSVNIQGESGKNEEIFVYSPRISLGVSYKKKSWQEKCTDKENLPKVLKLQKSFPCYNAVHKMGAEIGDEVVLVNPSEVIILMRQVPKGKIITLVDICKVLAQRHRVKACCSLTAGIFTMTAANAAEEAAHEGKPLNLPYWRTLKADGALNEKYPGGALAQKKLLEHEGFTILKKGKKYLVEDFEKHKMDLGQSHS